MSKKILIIGGEGHGSVIAACITDNRNRYNDLEWEVAGFINDFVTTVGSYPVLGKTSEIDKFVKQGFYFIYAIHLISRNNLTFETFNRINIPTNRLATIVHHSAFIAEDVELSPGVVVMPNVYIASRSRFGVGTLIKANVCIGHDVVTGPLCHLAMGSIINSYCKIGTCSDVAIGATVLANINIGNFAMAGAASLITHDIPDNEIHVGSPAIFHKNMSNE